MAYRNTPHTTPQKTPHRPPLSIPYTTAASQFLYGTSVITAALESARRQLYKLYMYAGERRQDLDRDARIESLARSRGVPVVFLREDGLRLMDKMSGFRPHNGYVLEASPIPQLPVTGLGPLVDAGFTVELAHQSAEEARVNGTSDLFPHASTTHKPLVVVVDHVVDPGNLGAILRSLSFLGAAAVGITSTGTATLTPVALKSSAGAVESMPLFSVAALPDFLLTSREHGWQVYAATPQPRRSAGALGRVDVHEVEDQDPLRRTPCVLVLGSEGEGLSRAVKGRADYEVAIPHVSRHAAAATSVDSLNVSVAAALLCSAFTRGHAKAQRGESLF